MKKKTIGLFIGASILCFALTGCNVMSRNFGGTSTVELPKGKKLVEATWKDNDLWYLVRDMKTNENPETLELIENSNCGVMQGKVVFKERK